jgi:dolichol-phosphate mannosyltransferase
MMATAPLRPRVPASDSDAPEFSLIVCCYFEESSIDEFHARLTKAAASLGRSFEIVMVNDGSTDGTFQKLKEIYERDPHVSTIIDFYRNAGQVNAMTAGLTHARGNAFVFIDSDLQLDPEELPALVTEFDKGYDVVSGCRRDRRDSVLRRISSKVANIVMRKVAGHALTDFGCTFKIFDAKLIRAFDLGPRKPWRTAYIFSRAATCKEVPISHHPRRYGESGWTLRKLFAFYMDHLVGVSERPFQLISLFCIAMAGVFFLRIALAWVVPLTVLPEITPGILLNALVLNLLILLAVLSGIGEYVIRNFLALQSYPSYVIREIHQKSPNAPTSA